jgi:hypothetical protein
MPVAADGRKGLLRFEDTGTEEWFYLVRITPREELEVDWPERRNE